MKRLIEMSSSPVSETAYYEWTEFGIQLLKNHGKFEEYGKPDVGVPLSQVVMKILIEAGRLEDLLQNVCVKRRQRSRSGHEFADVEGQSIGGTDPFDRLDTWGADLSAAKSANEGIPPGLFDWLSKMQDAIVTSLDGNSEEMQRKVTHLEECILGNFSSDHKAAKMFLQNVQNLMQGINGIRDKRESQQDGYETICQAWGIDMRHIP